MKRSRKERESATRSGVEVRALLRLTEPRSQPRPLDEPAEPLVVLNKFFCGNSCKSCLNFPCFFTLQTLACRHDPLDCRVVSGGVIRMDWPPRRGHSCGLRAGWLNYGNVAGAHPFWGGQPAFCPGRAEAS